MSDQAWAGLFNGLGEGMRTFLALQQAAEMRDRQEREQGKQDYEQGWRPESAVPKVELPGLSLAETPQQPSFLPPAGPKRPDTAPVQTDVIDPTRYDTRTGVEGMVYDRQENPVARAEAARARAMQLTQQQATQERDSNVQALVAAGMTPQMAQVVARGLRMPEAPKPERWQPTTREEALGFEEDRARIAAKYRPAPRPTAQGGGQGRQGSPPTEGERKALFFYRRAEPASQTMNQFDNIRALDDIAGKAGRFGNWAKTQEGRQLYQAGKVWAMAVLRQDSGGAISDQEMEQYFETYLPRPGDDETTLAQKREARRVVTDGLKELAGRALPPDMAPDVRGDTGTVSVNGKTYQIPER